MLIMLTVEKYENILVETGNERLVEYRSHQKTT
jgi:hypothetical protein